MHTRFLLPLLLWIVARKLYKQTGKKQTETEQIKKGRPIPSAKIGLSQETHLALSGDIFFLVTPVDLEVRRVLVSNAEASVKVC